MYGALAVLGAAGISAASAHAINQANLKNQNLVNSESINLANTQHQREVADLRLAGLNPILSANANGAAVPSLESAQQSNPVEGLADSMSSALTVHQTRRQMKLQNDILAEQLKQEKNRTWSLDLEESYNRIDTAARIEAITGIFNGEVYEMLGNSRESHKAYQALVQSYKNGVDSKVYLNSREHLIYRDVLDGIDSFGNTARSLKPAPVRASPTIYRNYYFGHR